MKGLVFKLLVFMGIVLFFTGCWNNPTAPTGPGILQVSMTDAPAVFDSVNIYIDSVQVHIANGDTIQGWQTLNSTPAKYDLNTLVNGASAIIGRDTLPAGTYSQIRLFFGTGSYVVENGQKYILSIPSRYQTGVTVDVDANVQDGFVYNITLDFEAGNSIFFSGTINNPQLTLNPVIRYGAAATTGIIAGIVSPYSFTSSIVATSSTDNYSTLTDGTGGFRLIYLTPGSYNIYVYPDDTTYKADTLTNIQINQGQTKYIGTVSLSLK